MLLTRVGIIQEVHGEKISINMNAAHRLRKASKYNHGRLLGHNLLIVRHSRIILGRILESFLNELMADVPKALPPFLYLLVSLDYLHPARCGSRLVQFKLPSSYSEGTLW